ncbi:hypothetical protein DSO57_1014093 [Entomophthora muscae]|uniref:Uncharacterized protein n=1 Tax=Entomophthora muscae TaxID=34485 RepID=A0ACC2UGF7_9FUNG|nr:hypothetical protein DSO57_1014093 [Entomophthora muscae]
MFSLAPFLLLLWSTLPDLWSKIASSAFLVGNNPSSLLDLPSGLMFSGQVEVSGAHSQLGEAQLCAPPGPCNALSCSHLYALVAHHFGADGIEHLLPSAIPCVLPVVPPSSGHPSSPLGGILVTLLQDMHLTHSRAVVRENCAASISGLSSCGPLILTMNLQNPPQCQGCHNCGHIGHHSQVCTNPWVEGANSKEQTGKEQLT